MEEEVEILLKSAGNGIWFRGKKANFNLYFKGIMKKTPSEYRKEFR
jgi:hypothetical protein